MQSKQFMPGVVLDVLSTISIFGANIAVSNTARHDKQQADLQKSF